MSKHQKCGLELEIDLFKKYSLNNLQVLNVPKPSLPQKTFNYMKWSKRF